MISLPRLTRRGLLASSIGLLAPARLGAAPIATDRKLLVVLCKGGWDTSRLFNPAFDSEYVSMETDADTMEIGGFRLVDSPSRPTVRAWFEAWHDRAAIVNGFEVRSITHERCLRLLMSADGPEDWPAILASNAAVARALPHLVLSGPSYTTATTSSVVRVGESGQLPDLLTGAALTGVPLPSAATTALQQAVLRDRILRRGGLESYTRALEDLDTLQGSGLNLAGEVVDELCGGVMGQLLVALDAFEADRARCAIVQYGGNCGPDWDQHSDIGHQSNSFEELFQHLDQLSLELASRTGVSGPLLDEVTVLVCSEMGRHPALNLQGGKDHWTYTSCLLFGAGVRGDVQVGRYDDGGFGQPVDLDTGEDGTVSLLPGNLGATLLALGDVDPAGFVEEAPIRAVIA